MTSARPLVARPGAKKTRDDWLTEVTAAMVPWFADLGFPLPDHRISTGFPRSGGRSRQTVEAWSEDEGKSFTVIVRPDQADPYRVAAALAHQFARIAAGPRDEHGHLFRHIAVSLGLRGRKTEQPPGLMFEKLAEPILAQAGPLPVTSPGQSSNGGHKTQTSRLIKVSCRQCGYLARVSRKWLDDAGAPHCPLHGQMHVSS